MFPKLVTVYSGRKRPRKVVYLRLVDRVKEKGRWKDRALLNLGRQDVLGRKALGELLKKLRRFSDEVLVTPEEIESRQARDYGAVLVGQKLWREIGIEGWIKDICGQPLPGSLGEAGVLAMAVNRLTSPRSKLALYDWLPTVYLPQWQEEPFRELEDEALAERFYQTMDWLIRGKNKETIEERIGSWVRTLFPIEVVFYDITNVQFEGWEELKQARFGHIRLGRRNHKQILLGLVMVEGLPVASHLFRGNRAEKTTTLWVRDKLKKQFNVGRIVFVCDRGMIRENTLAEIEAKQDGYIVALKRRRCEEVEPLLEEDSASFVPIQVDQEGRILLSAWEAPEQEGKRRIVAFNPLVAKEERKKRQEVISEMGGELEHLRSRVQTGAEKPMKVKAIVAVAEEILSHKHGKRYFCYQCERDGQFEYGPHVKGRALEEKLDGKFVIKTTEHKLSIKEVVFKYKDLMDVEDGFRELKDFIRVAPVFHWRYRRVKAHLFICVLALLLERYLEQKLKKAGLELSARKALEKLGTIKVVENQVGPLILKYVTPPNQELDRILAACGIFRLPRILPAAGRARLPVSLK